MIRPILALLLCAAMAASPAAAQTPAEESDVASLMRQRVEMFMDQVSATMEREGGGAGYVVDVSEDAQSAISVVVRDIALFGPDFVWTIGDAELDLVPDGPDRYRAVLRLPRTASRYDGGGAPLGGISLGGQRCVWSYVPSIDVWTESDCVFKDLVFRGNIPDAGEALLSVDRVALRSSLREDRDGKWSGPVSMNVEDVQFGVNGGEILELARLDASVVYGGWDLVFLAAANKAVQEMQDSFAISGPAGEELMKKTSVRLVDLAMARAPLMESMSMTVVLTDFHVRDPDSFEEIGFDAVNVGVGMEGMDTNAASFFFEYGHAGLAAPLSDPEADLVPLAFDLRLALRDLPSLDLAVLGVDTFRNAVNDLVPFEARDFAMLVLQRVLRARSVFEIERLGYESAALRADLAGRFTASGESPRMAVGTARLEVLGLAGLVERMTGMAASGDTDALDAAQALEVMQAMGRRVEEGGASRYVYDLEVAPDGRVLLNGNDIGGLLLEDAMR
ncbi:MAG: hypothetical protein J4G15_08765 [Alphaproteobacteria bacterium]|nr:hypothetical protein [Alphaproteobacteria bacterium]